VVRCAIVAEAGKEAEEAAVVVEERGVRGGLRFAVGVRGWLGGGDSSGGGDGARRGRSGGCGAITLPLAASGTAVVVGVVFGGVGLRVARGVLGWSAD
jgi:hypothetical protein